MAVPFRRKSSRRKKIGNSGILYAFKKKSLRQLAKCSNCETLKTPHYACHKCHVYRGKKY